MRLKLGSSEVHVWIRSRQSQANWRFPNGFWSGYKAFGLALGRLNFMFLLKGGIL